MNPTAAIPLTSVFIFESHNIRTIEKDGEVWFVAKDVAEVLGYKEPGLAVRTHCKGGAKHSLPTNGGAQDVVFIPERDVYRLIMRSKLPAAEKFEDWVVSEVIPSIRKHGHYGQVPALPTDPMEILKLVFDAQQATNEQLAQANERVKLVEQNVTKILDTVRLHQWQCYELKAAVTQKAQELHEAHKVHYPLLFPGIWGFVKRHFRVSTYSAIPTVRFDEAMTIVRGITLEQLPDYVVNSIKGVAA